MLELQFCTFYINEIYFGIDLQKVQEVIRNQKITRVPLAPPDICGLINLRGQIVTVIDLKLRFEMLQSTSGNAAFATTANEQVSYNIVVYNDSEIVSLQVDDIGDIVKATQDDFESPPATLNSKIQQLLKGAYKLPDGFLLILDTDKILEVKEMKLKK
jgi:purine-binding chemotaxis protein CheW